MYVVRLRATEDGIVDLAGNEVVSTVDVVYDVDSELNNNFKRMRFNNGTATFKCLPKNQIGTEDFTISMHVYYPESQHQYQYYFMSYFTIMNYIGIVSASNEAYWRDNDGRMLFYSLSHLDNVKIFEDNTELYYQKYYHLAIVRKNGLVKAIINGKPYMEPIQIYNNIEFLPSDKNFHIGMMFDNLVNGAPFILDDYCIIKNKALWWDKDFTPPTTYLPDKI